MGLGLAAVGVGAGISALSGMGAGARRRRELMKAIAALRAAQPQGYLTPEDYAAAEITRGRQTETAGKMVGQQRSEVVNRYAQRGLGGSPSEERSLGRLSDIEAIARQHAGELSSEQLYNVSQGREQFGRQKELAIFGAQAGLANMEGQRADLQQSTFLNSLNEFLPTLIDYYGGGTKTAGTGIVNTSNYGYDPSVISRRPV